MLLAGVGVGLAALLAALPARAATVSCAAGSTAVALVPGATGSCAISYALTPDQAQDQRFTVTVDIDTTSASGANGRRDPKAGEALLDGRSTGLQVSVSDSAGHRFGIGSPACTGAYPDATRCSSRDHGQEVPSAVAVRNWRDTITIAWSLPAAAGNPYQGGSATVSETLHINGDPVTPSDATTTGGAGGVSTPATGVALASVSSLVLCASGLALVVMGVRGSRIVKLRRWRGRAWRFIEALRPPG